MPAEQRSAKSTEGRTARRAPPADAVRQALQHQRRVFDTTGRWLRIGEVLLLRGDIAEDNLRELMGSGLFPNGRSRIDAELAGEIALRRGLLSPEQFAEALDQQLQERARGDAHRPLGTILVSKSYLRPKDLKACEAELRRDIRLRDAESKRAAKNAGEKPQLTPLDARYVSAARRGELPAREIVTALERAPNVQKLLGRRVALWEELLVREIITPGQHQRVLDESFNVRDEGTGSWLLGGILVEFGYATAADVEAALAVRAAEARKSGEKPRPLGEILVERRICSLTELEEALRIQKLRREGATGRRRIGPRELPVRPALLVAVLVAVIGGLFVVAWPEYRFRRALALVNDAAAPLEKRVAAAAVLRADPRPAAIMALASAADLRVPEQVRRVSLEALAKSDTPVAGQKIRAALADDSAPLRAVAAWACGDRGDATARAQLRERLQDESPSVRLAAARSLALFRESDGRDLLVAVLRPDRGDRRRLAADLGRSSGDVLAAIPEALERLSGFAFGDAYERWEVWLSLQPIADEVCGRQRGPQVVARFARLLESDYLSVRFAAARGLAHLGDSRGMALLVRALDRDDRVFRMALESERGVEVERIAPEIAALLSLLTGRSFGTDYSAWSSWLHERHPEAGGQ